MEQTRGAIIKAFGQLLEEKPMNKITVKDIVERCGINRNTFYYHFTFYEYPTFPPLPYIMCMHFSHGQGIG